MPVTLEHDETRCIVRLEGDLNISNSAHLQELLLQALALQVPVHVDLSAISEVDITILQLLWAASRKAQTVGKELLFGGPLPDSISTTASHAGLALPGTPA